VVITVPPTVAAFAGFWAASLELEQAAARRGRIRAGIRRRRVVFTMGSLY